MRPEVGTQAQFKKNLPPMDSVSSQSRKQLLHISNKSRDVLQWDRDICFCVPEQEYLASLLEKQDAL